MVNFHPETREIILNVAETILSGRLNQSTRQRLREKDVADISNTCKLFAYTPV